MGNATNIPSVPNYKKAAQEQQRSGMYNQSGPFYSGQWNQNGKDKFGNDTYTYTNQLDKQHQDIVNKGLQNWYQANNEGNLDIDPGNITQHYMKNWHTINDPFIDQEQQSLRTRLQNQGITEGSEAWDAEHNRFAQEKNRLYTRASQEGYQQELNARIAQRKLATEGLNNSLNIENSVPQAQNPGQVNYLEAAANKFRGEMAGYQARQKANPWGFFANTLGTLGGAALGGNGFWDYLYKDKPQSGSGSGGGSGGGNVDYAKNILPKHYFWSNGKP